MNRTLIVALTSVALASPSFAASIGTPQFDGIIVGGQTIKKFAPTPEALGAPVSGDATTAIQNAVATGGPVHFFPRSYGYTADTVDVTTFGVFPSATHLTDVIGNEDIRDRNGRVIGLAYNHGEKVSYTGTFNSTVPATLITGGNLVAPPMSNAVPAGPVDVIAHWYGDWGLDWYRQQTNIGSQAFYSWYDGAYNFRSAPAYDPQRESIMGHYRNDDPNVLDWQCYWLREAGVKAIVPAAFDLEIGTWASATDRNLWIYRLFNNAPNCLGLSYIPWARSGNFNSQVQSGTAPHPGAPNDIACTSDVSCALVTSSIADLLAQWQSLYYQLEPAFPNNYITKFGGKRYFTVYVWDTEQLRHLLDTGSASTNTSAWLQARAAEVATNQNVDGLAVLCHNCTPDATMSRATLLTNKVLLLPDQYGGPADSTQAGMSGGSSTYSTYVSAYAPPTTGEMLSVSTSLKTLAPLTTGFNYPGSTPALWLSLLSKAERWVASHPTTLVQAVSVYNVSEWWEGGPGLSPNLQDGWGYLDAVRKASAGAQ
jgi:hypothetical protein